VHYLRQKSSPQTEIGNYEADTPDRQFETADRELEIKAQFLLNQHYPDHLWHVEASHRQGSLLIRHLAFSDRAWLVKIADLKNDRSLRKIVMYGGEILERYQVPRAGFDMAHYRMAEAKFAPLFNRWKVPT